MNERHQILCGYEMSVDPKTYGSRLCRREAIVLIHMREFGNIALCPIHYSKGTRHAIAAQKFAVVRLDD